MTDIKSFPPIDFQDFRLDKRSRQRLNFKYLPDYTRFLLNNRLKELAKIQLELFRELDPPIFKYFSGRPDEELQKIGLKGLETLFSAIADHQSAEYIENALRGWINNELPQISRSQIEAEDITMISLIRRRLFRQFIAEYTQDFNKIICILNETDEFTTISETSSLQFRLGLQHSLIKEKDIELLNQEERYFRMIDEVEDYAILRLSPAGIIENWNTGAEKIKGYKGIEIIGKHFRIFYSPEDQESGLPESLIKKASGEGKALHEGWRLRKDGSRFWGSILITALHDAAGSVVGYSKVTRDLTQMKLAENNLKEHAAQIEKTNIQLEEKNKQLESFNYIASHDLKEPLRKIKLFVSRLKDDPYLSLNARETIEKVENASTRMQDLIEGLLLYCQADHFAVTGLVNLDSLLDDVISDFSDLSDGNEMEITKTSLPSLKVNDIQFRQVFNNLISNAIKYKKENTRLKLNIYSKIDLRADSKGSTMATLQLIFEDNGIGFEPDYANKIFGLFQRLHDQSKYAGTGLGLAICKKIVENHGGEITAEGKPGSGARFCIFLPVDGHL